MFPICCSVGKLSFTKTLFSFALFDDFLLASRKVPFNMFASIVLLTMEDIGGRCKEKSINIFLVSSVVLNYNDSRFALNNNNEIK